MTNARPPRRFFLDRIEGDVAVLLPEGDDEEQDEPAEEQHVPKAVLPPDAREGDWLTALPGQEDDGDARDAEPPRVGFAVDRAGTDTAKKRVQSLMDELSSN